MIKMINEKTGIFPQHLVSVVDGELYLGAIFEPVVDFSTNTVRKNIKRLRVYQYRDERYHKVKPSLENELIALLANKEVYNYQI